MGKIFKTLLLKITYNCKSQNSSNLHRSFLVYMPVVQNLDFKIMVGGGGIGA
jgi:hypothetical protein